MTSGLITRLSKLDAPCTHREAIKLADQSPFGGQEWAWFVRALEGSVDAVIALARRLYPDAMYRVGNDGEGPDPSLYLGELFIPGEQKDSYFTGHSPVDAVSLCIALLRAKEASNA